MVSLPKGIETPTGTIRPLDPRLSAGERTIFAFLNFLAPVENILPVLRSGRLVPECLGEMGRLDQMLLRGPWSAGKASAPQVPSEPEKPAHGPENGPNVAAAVPAYAVASLSSR